MYWFWEYMRDTYDTRQKWARRLSMVMGVVLIFKFLVDPDPIGVQLHSLWNFHYWYWGHMYASYIQPWVPEITFERKVFFSTTAVSSAVSVVTWHWFCARRKRRLQKTQ